MSSSRTAPYTALLTAFCDGRLLPSEFEELFVFLFKNDPTGRDPETYEALNTCFTAVDAFCEDAELRALTSDGVDADDLRRAALLALDHLTKLVDSEATIDLPGLAGFMRGYLHQDWDLEAASPTDLFETFVHTEEEPLVAQVDREIEWLLRQCLNDDELADLLSALGSCFDPRFSGVSPSAWLAAVRRAIAARFAGTAES